MSFVDVIIVIVCGINVLSIIHYGIRANRYRIAAERLEQSRKYLMESVKKTSNILLAQHDVWKHSVN